MRDSIVFYRSFYEAIKDLPPEQFKASVQVIMEYGLDSREPETTGIEKTIYTLVKPQIDANTKRYQNGKKGGRPKTEEEPSNNLVTTKEKPIENHPITKPEPNVNVNVNDNDNVNDKEIKHMRAFAPPTVSAVDDYCKEKGYKVDAERFIDFYSSKGWMVGKSKMKDWKASVRNWARSEVPPKQKPQTGNRFNNFNQRDYDYDKLEQQLFVAQGGETCQTDQ